MSPRDKRDVTDLHRQLMDRFPHAFPKDYNALRPLKLGIHADILHRWPEVDLVLLRRALANHTRRDGYLLALIHGRGDRRYDLDGQPVGSVTPEERAEAQKRLEASTQRGQAQAARVREHLALAAKRRQQRERERRNREAKAARKAEYERQQQEIAARKAALLAQGIVPESRTERKRRLDREAAARSKGQPRAEVPAVFERRPPAPPPARALAGVGERPARTRDRPEPAPDRPLPPVEFKKKRRVGPTRMKAPGPKTGSRDTV